MINKLKIENFKSIKNATINFSKLNILCGENASGKTSIIHSILIAVQKTKSDYTADGKIVKIGELNEIKNYDAEKDLSIDLYCNNTQKTIKFIKNEDVSLNKNSKLIVTPDPSEIISYEENLFYLSSNRVGVVDTYSKGNYLFGSNGEAVIDFLYQQQDEQFSSYYMAFFNKKHKGTNISENRKFIEHVRYWMEYITSETLTINSVLNTNQYVLLFGKDTRPINTGSGYSFILPIVIVCLGAILVGKETPTVILENPEIYLHPEAQNKLVEFFLFCKNFVQLIIESHSEHILERVLKNRQVDCKIFVVELYNKETKISTLTHKNFKTAPIAYSEVIYKAFGILTPELHILLYGQLQNRYNITSGTLSNIMSFDRYLAGLPNVCSKIWINSKNGTQYNTLPTFIRNKIDHPEAKDPTTKKQYSYSDNELKMSIDWMLSLL